MHNQNCTCCIFPIDSDSKLIITYDRNYKKYNSYDTKKVNKVTSVPKFDTINDNIFINFINRYTASIYKYDTLHDDKVKLDKVIDKLDIEESSKEID